MFVILIMIVIVIIIIVFCSFINRYEHFTLQQLSGKGFKGIWPINRDYYSKLINLVFC